MGRSPAALAAMDLAYALARPALFRVEAERAHELILTVLALGARSPAALRVIHRLLGMDDPRHALEVFGLRFRNPIGVAAGLDKNARAVPVWGALGFGHVEIGTVTPRPQGGAPTPRVFRLREDRALINRMGFPNEGALAIAARLARRPRSPRILVGGNVGKGADTPLERAGDDYELAARLLLPHVDYLAINVSSPNTPGLRQLQAPEQIAEILNRVRPLGARPVLLKLAPDLDPAVLPELVAAAREAGASGFIATNTTLSRDGVRHPLAHEAGGLSGVPLRTRATAFIARLAALAGHDLPVIGVGGISTAADLRAHVGSGARLVQVYTSLVYEGPTIAARLLQGLPCTDAEAAPARR